MYPYDGDPQTCRSLLFSDGSFGSEIDTDDYESTNVIFVHCRVGIGVLGKEENHISFLLKPL